MNLDDDLLPFVSTAETGRKDQRNIVVSVGGTLPSADQLVRAVSAGLGVEVNGYTISGEFSLDYLEPIVEKVRQLFINIGNTVETNAQILRAADRLENLVWQYASPSDVVDLAGLPRLRRFVGHLCPQIQSLLNSPRLTEALLYGDEPRRFPTIGAPLESLLITGHRSMDRLPELKHPELLRSFRVDMPRRFDAASLLAAPNLKKVQLNGVGRLENVAALAGLSKLTRLEVEGASQEDWDVLVDCSVSSALFILSPSPSKRLRDEGARRGWVVAGKHDQRSDRLAPFDLLDPWGEGGGPVLHLDDFAALTELIAASLGEEGFDEGEVNGHLAEDLVRAACEADPELSAAVIEFDSEAGGMYAAFPTKELALRAVKATLALIRDASTLRTLLVSEV